MKKLKTITQLSILITTPSLLAYPEQSLPQASAQTVNWFGDWWWGTQEQATEWIRPTTYDGIMQMLEDLESGELERRYPPEQLERVNEYLATLAKEGILPDEFYEEALLEEDVEDLMYGEDSAFELTRYLENSSEYMIIPAVFNGYSSYNVIQCGKISNAWKKTKKFVKKHKKEIIIGAVVVVAVTVVAVAVVAASSVSAATAAAAGAAAGVGSGSSDPGNSESKNSESMEEAPLSIDANEAPVMKAAIDEHIASFKEFLIEDKVAQQTPSSKGWDELSFGEKAKEVGSGFAHQAYDEILDLVKVVPQLCEEVKELGSRLLPDSLSPPNNGEMCSPMENYENLVAKGHGVIDDVFSTDQAEFFTSEARVKESMNNFAIGMIPLPGGIPKVFSNTNNLVKAGNAIDRAGFTKVGRGLMKHGYREGSGFPKPVGNPAQINAQGQKMLESILHHPERECILYDSSRMGKTVDIYAPNIGGVRYSLEGEFIGFLEFKK